MIASAVDLSLVLPTFPLNPFDESNLLKRGQLPNLVDKSRRDLNLVPVVLNFDRNSVEYDGSRLNEPRPARGLDCVKLLVGKPSLNPRPAKSFVITVKNARNAARQALVACNSVSQMVWKVDVLPVGAGSVGHFGLQKKKCRRVINGETISPPARAPQISTSGTRSALLGRTALQINKSSGITLRAEALAPPSARLIGKRVGGRRNGRAAITSTVADLLPESSVIAAGLKANVSARVYDKEAQFAVIAGLECEAGHRSLLAPVAS